MSGVVRSHMIDAPGFLPLAGLCCGLMEKSIPVEAARAFKIRLRGWLEPTAIALQRHFPTLEPHRGFALLMHSYALIVGLWQLLSPTPVREAILHDAELEMFNLDYAEELDKALGALWAGTLASEAALTQPRRGMAGSKASVLSPSKSRSRK
jgi:hypothetical protein